MRQSETAVRQSETAVGGVDAFPPAGERVSVWGVESQRLGLWKSSKFALWALKV